MDRKWQTTNSGSSHLLQLPSGPSANDFCAKDSRPRTCPGFRLTPALHWNLNNSALKTLSKSQEEELYGLFKFYDSSTVGDALPSINCTRFLEVLRDAKLVGCDSENTDLSAKDLQVERVEQIFAQAVMGKMRVYLDADEQPALTFSLFCGALMSCAMVLHPSIRPEVALQQIIPMLLDNIVEGREFETKGLISHLPSDGVMSLWAPEESQSTEAPQDFRELTSFQQVIADHTRDKVADELRMEKVGRHYEIPENLIANFHPDTISLISSKFRMFDAFDCGKLPKQELFALLSSLGRHLDLPEPCDVLKTLRKSGSDNSSDELTLAQLLQLIETARESKRSSATTKLAAMKIRMARESAAVKNNLLSKAPQFESIAVDKEENIESAQKTRHASSKNSTGKRNSSVVLRPRKSTLGGAGNTPDATSHTPPSSSHRNSKMRNVQKKPLVDRKLSTLSKVDTVNDCDTFEGPQPVPESQFSSGNREVNGDGDEKTLEYLANIDHDTQVRCPSNGITVQMHEPPSASNSKTIRIFLLVGGDHDGAMCCTISLVFTTKEIMEKEGVYFTAGPSETSRMTPVLPVQKTPSNALRMLKKCVVSRLKQGFELRPPDQLDIVDKMLENLLRRQPHSRCPTKTTRRTASASQTRQFLTQTAVSRVRQLPQRVKSAPSSKTRNHYPQANLPSNYKSFVALWEVSQNSNAWIHDVNSASPLKLATTQTQSRFFRDSQSRPLRLLPRHNNRVEDH